MITSTAPTAATPVRVATLPFSSPVPFAGAGDAIGGGKLGRIDLKKLLIYAAAGAAAGMVIPVIPGGPIGGALIGAALAVLL